MAVDHRWTWPSQSPAATIDPSSFSARDVVTAFFGVPGTVTVRLTVPVRGSQKLIVLPVAAAAGAPAAAPAAVATVATVGVATASADPSALTPKALTVPGIWSNVVPGSGAGAPLAAFTKYRPVPVRIVCTYDQRSTKVLTSVAVYPDDRVGFDAEYEAVKANDPQVAQIPGIGEAAFLSGVVLYAIKGAFIVVVVAMGPGEVADAKAKLLHLGPKAVARLP